MIPETGRRFGPYEIQGRLGGGGMGHVYRAWDARLHREVALKLLHNEYAMPGMRERFLREARAASALNHPHICTIFDIGEQDGDPYLVMELLEGETLKSRIERSTIQVDDMICIAREVAEALAAAHAKGIVHRDVKPANIFLCAKPNGKVQAKVLDFGLAKFEDGPLGARGRHLEITSIGSTVGTLAYMSPEQARGEVLDSRSDLFSLGVVMYEMATRHVPFQGATSALVFVKLLNHAPEPVREWNDAVSRDLERIIDKLMAKERTARFQTAAELDQALERLGEKPQGGGWLRKAVATVPLVRAADPIVRQNRRNPRRRSGDNEVEPQPAAGATPGRSSSSSEPALVLRPVARVPRDETTPRPTNNLVQQTAPAAEPVASSEAATRTEFFEPRRLERSSPEPSQAVTAPAASQPAAKQARAATALESAPRLVAVPELGSAVVEDGVESGVTEAMVEAPAPSLAEESEPVLDLRPRDPVAAQGLVPRRRGTRRRRGRTLWVVGAIALVAVLFSAGLLFLNRGHFGPTMLTETDPVVLTEVVNNTGDKSLDGSVALGLQMALAQSPYLKLVSGDAYRSALHLTGTEAGEPVTAIRARATASRLGAKAYLFGSVQGASAPYTLHMDMINASTNDVMASVDEHTSSLQALPGAIDRLADGIRAAAGEDTDSINLTHVAIAHEATGNLDALHAYAQGEDAQVSGHLADALGYFQEAATLEPKFVQAQMRLVVLYRKQRAEVAAADAARLALAAADGTTERTRTLAQYEYEMNASGDYARATALIRHLLTVSPHDSVVMSDLARVLRLEGRMGDALGMAQQAIAADAFNLDAYIQAESALVSLDRYDAALQVEEQVQRLGLARVGGSLIPAYLEGRQEIVDRAVSDYQSRKPGQRSDWNFGLYLDNSGRLANGLSIWRSNAAAALQMKGLASTAAYLLAQGALDRAILGDCGNALAMAHESAAHPQGVTALFNSGMAEALCNEPASANKVVDDLQRLYPQSTDVNEYLLADLKAAIVLQANDPEAALELLKPTRQYDLISLTPFLRGRAHVALRQVQIGIVDFQTVLSHRGITFIVGTDVYPMAEIGVARAFADTGDMGNSADAYRRFLELWLYADINQPLLEEARNKVAVAK